MKKLRQKNGEAFTAGTIVICFVVGLLLNAAKTTGLPKPGSKPRLAAGAINPGVNPNHP